MEFRILGPLEVIQDGRQIHLGGAKQRALLVILLLHANDLVSGDQLIDALWDEAPPETAQKALQVYVSKLRKALGKERLETKAPGYRLRVESGELDLERFQHLAEERPREALELWRGQPLVEFTYQRFAQAEIARLDELHLACLERRIDEDLQRGRHAGARRRARAACARASAARTPACPAHARALSLGTTGGSARRLPGGAARSN